MDSDISKAGWDVFMFGIPLIAFLLFGFFRLDEAFTSRKRGPASPPATETKIDGQGTSMRSDPDGRPWDDEN